MSFEEAQTVFYDDFATQFVDETAHQEERFLMLGISNLARLLVVVHCERGENEEVIRIISARKATAFESKFYEGQQI